jgi:hypothetical protein
MGTIGVVPSGLQWQYARQAYVLHATVRSVKRVSVFLSHPQLEALRQVAEAKGRPYAELLREAVDQYLSQEHREPPSTSKSDRRRAPTRRRS